MFSIHILLPRQIPIYWAKPSIPHSTMKEHPDIVKFCHFSAYVRTRSAGILRGLTPWHTDFGRKSSVLHLAGDVQALSTHVRSDCPQCELDSAKPPINKKRTRTLSHRELGSSTNCMVDGTGLEPVTSCTSSRCSTS